MAESGHSLESIKASIAARKPDFDAYIGKQPSLLCMLNYSSTNHTFLFCFFEKNHTATLSSKSI